MRQLADRNVLLYVLWFICGTKVQPLRIHISPQHLIFTHVLQCFCFKKKVSFNRICVCNNISLCIISHFLHYNVKLMTILYSLQLHAKKGRTCIIQFSTLILMCRFHEFKTNTVKVRTRLMRSLHALCEKIGPKCGNCACSVVRKSLKQLLFSEDKQIRKHTQPSK